MLCTPGLLLQLTVAHMLSNCISKSSYVFLICLGVCLLTFLKSYSIADKGQRGCGLNIIGRSVWARINVIVSCTQVAILGISFHCKLLSCCPAIRIYSPSYFHGFTCKPSRRT